jgi:hypothetical protein
VTLYVAEISGRGIVAFEAEDEAAAEARLADGAFRRDLYVFQSEGRALWDGVSAVRLRAAQPFEVEVWHARRTKVGRSGESDGYWRAFLISVVNPIKYDDDGD